MPPAIWKPILENFILKKRPARTAAHYKQIWDHNWSPLLVNGLNLKDKLQGALDAKSFLEGGEYVVEFATRYGTPPIQESYAKLIWSGCEKVIAIPLFPQTAISTTKTCIEKVREVASNYNAELICIEGYSENELYIKAIANSVRSHWQPTKNSALIASFHAIPNSHVKRGDTYVEQIDQTLKDVSEELGFPLIKAFHSPFEDSRKWTGPSIDQVRESCITQGIKDVAIITPGFCSDCLETLYDIAMIEREKFESAGISFTYIPALNSSDSFVKLLLSLLRI